MARYIFIDQNDGARGFGPALRWQECVAREDDQVLFSEIRRNGMRHKNADAEQRDRPDN
jgi:hypothetical protein